MGLGLRSYTVGGDIHRAGSVGLQIQLQIKQPSLPAQTEVCDFGAFFLSLSGS